MARYARSSDIDKLKEKYADIRNETLLLEAHEDGLEGGYELRLVTRSRRLTPSMLDVLNEYGFGVEYLGQDEDDGLHKWALVE